MSHKATYWAISRAGLTPVQKLTLMALADCHNGHTGDCHPAIDTLAQVVNVSRSTVKRALGDLAKMGLIRSEERFAAGRQTSNGYRLNFSAGTAINEGVQNEPAGGSKRTGGGFTGEPGGGFTGEPRTGNKEPGNEPEGGQLTLTPQTPAPANSSKQKRASQIGNWRPSEAQVFEAAVQIFGTSKPEAITKAEGIVDAFVDYALDKGRVSKDWDAAWRMWVKKEAEFQARKRY